jgi:hypothetical protein
MDNTISQVAAIGLAPGLLGNSFPGIEIVLGFDMGLGVNPANNSSTWRLE